MFGKTGTDKPSDMYCIGATLFELLSGLPPFYSDNLDTLYNNIKRGNLQFPKSVPESARDFIRQLMNQEPACRPNIEMCKAHPWFSDLDWAAVEAKEVRPPRLGPGWA